MTKRQFESRMRRAQSAQHTTTEPNESEYWAGYQRGLRRAYHGDKFGTEREHQQMLAAVDSDDSSRSARGRGYRDALTLDAEQKSEQIQFRVTPSEKSSIEIAAGTAGVTDYLLTLHRENISNK